jgi:hypothetical protein
VAAASGSRRKLKQALRELRERKAERERFTVILAGSAIEDHGRGLWLRPERISQEYHDRNIKRPAGGRNTVIFLPAGRKIEKETTTARHDARQSSFRSQALACSAG